MPQKTKLSIIFFDIGDTLGTPIIADGKFSELRVFPGVVEILTDLKANSLRLGIISNTGNEAVEDVDNVLGKAGLLEFFDKPLRIYSSNPEIGTTKKEPLIFEKAAGRAETEPGQCVFVGENADERSVALKAHYGAVVPDPKLVQAVLAGETLIYAKLDVSAVQFHAKRALRWNTARVNRLARLQQLNLARSLVPGGEEAVARGERVQEFDAELSSARRMTIESEKSFVATQGEGWRGLLKDINLVPLLLTVEQGNKTVLYVVTTVADYCQLQDMGFQPVRLGSENAPAKTDLYLLRDDLALVKGVNRAGNAAFFFGKGAAVAYNIGSADSAIIVALPPERTVGEFHFQRAKHGHTVKALYDARLLDAAPQTDPIEVDSERLARIVADLPKIDGASLNERVDRYSGKKPTLVDPSRKIQSRHIDHPDNRGLAPSEFHQKPSLTIQELLAEFGSISGGRLAVSLQAFSHNGKRYYNVQAELAGDDSSREIVLMTAHLDSTAARDEDQNDSTDPAPGADDDASGIAGVLTAAQVLVGRYATKKPRRSIRFVVFNCEEEGLVGSRAYARAQKAAGVPIAAVFQMDMIGYNVEPPANWELHSGFTPSRSVEKRSEALAEILKQLTPRIAPDLPLPELYSGGSFPDGDPGEGRSDHSSFHEQGYASCLASEDIFPGTHDHEENPSYHSKRDTFIDPLYASSIATVVLGAVVYIAENSIQSTTNNSMTSENKIEKDDRLIATRLAELRAKGVLDLNPPIVGSRVNIYKQDPSIELKYRTVYLPEEVLPGPSDAKIQLQGVSSLEPNVEGDFIYKPETSPEEFDAAHTFAVARMVLTMFERQAKVLNVPLGPWQWSGQSAVPISLYPDAGETRNAYYDRDERAVKFFHFTTREAPGTVIYTCQSLDIVAHEVGHAILDGLREDWWVDSPLIGGLHESFGDLTSIFLILSQTDLVEYVVAQTKGDLHQKTILSALAEQFGASLGKPNSGLRNANALRPDGKPLKLSDVTLEVHDVSQVFTGAVYDSLADYYSLRRQSAQKDDALVLYEVGLEVGGVLLKAIVSATGIDPTRAYSQMAEKLIATARESAIAAKRPELEKLAEYFQLHFEQREVLGDNAKTFRFGKEKSFQNTGPCSCGTMGRLLGRSSRLHRVS